MLPRSHLARLNNLYGSNCLIFLCEVDRNNRDTKEHFSVCVIGPEISWNKSGNCIDRVLSMNYGWFLERKIRNPLVYVADMLKKLRGSGQPYLANVKIVLM